MRYKPDYTPLKHTMLDRGITRSDLLKITNIAPNTFTKVNKGEWLSLKIIAQFCEALDCDIEDVVKFVDMSKYVRDENGLIKLFLTEEGQRSFNKGKDK